MTFFSSNLNYYNYCDKKFFVFFFKTTSAILGCGNRGCKKKKDKKILGCFSIAIYLLPSRLQKGKTLHLCSWSMMRFMHSKASYTHTHKCRLLEPPVAPPPINQFTANLTQHKPKYLYTGLSHAQELFVLENLIVECNGRNPPPQRVSALAASLFHQSVAAHQQSQTEQK